MPALQPVGFIVSTLVLALSLLMLIPAATDAAFGHPDWVVFLLSSGVGAAIGGMGALTWRTRPISLGLRQAFLVTTLSWVTMSAVAALPLFFSTLDVTYTDAFFEAMSGLTTTGSTVLVGLDDMPPGILLWRSLMQWIGGAGIIVMGMAILPFLRVGGMQLFRTESSDRSDKVLPRPGQIATAIGSVYVSLSLLCAVFYTLAGMTPFEAVNHMMTTVATGGYSTSDGSLGHWGASVHWVGTLFMLSGSIPFVLYVRALSGNPAAIYRDTQLISLLAGLLTAIALVSTWLVASKQVEAIEAIRAAAFNIVSIVTTTGYATTDYGAWGSFAAVVFLFLTFVGGCTGSTSGGIKIFRFEVIARIILRIMAQLVHPHQIYRLTYQGRRIGEDVTTGVVAFFAFFTTALAALSLVLSLMGLDLITAVSGAATALANVGPGLGPEIGPAGNFSGLPALAKWLLCFGMLLGRLEIFTVIVLFTPTFWRD